VRIVKLYITIYRVFHDFRA